MENTISRPQQYRAFNEEVWFPASPSVVVSKDDLEQLKRQADKNVRKRMRFCAHQNEQEPVHEMFIVHTPHTYVRPHKHLKKNESFHVLEGLADVVVFDDQGRPLEVLPMGAYDSGRLFYYRSADARYHTVLVRSEVLVFYEAAQGPFHRSDTVFPAWAPAGDDPAAVREYIGALEQLVTEWLARGVRS